MTKPPRNCGKRLPFPKSDPKSLTCSVESDEFEATMRASSPLGFLFVVPFLSRSGQGIGAIAVVLLLALLIFSIAAFGFAVADTRKQPPFPLQGERDDA